MAYEQPRMQSEPLACTCGSAPFSKSFATAEAFPEKAAMCSGLRWCWSKRFTFTPSTANLGNQKLRIEFKEVSSDLHE